MRTIQIIILFLGFQFQSKAQCETNIYGQSLEKNMFIFCYLENEPNFEYVAEITSIEEDGFTCRFLHTQSMYEFYDVWIKFGKSHRLQAKVKSSNGGKYGAGTIFIMNVYMTDPEDCDLTTSSSNNPYNIIATFEDNKKFLGRLQKTNEGYTIKFAHTGSVYMTDDNFRVLSQKGGGYSIGSQMEVVHARLLSFEN